MPTRPATAPTRRARALRAALAGLVLCAGLAGPTAASADARALAHYERLPRAERVAIEYDLIWAGGVDMVTNGVVGSESIAAIRRFEREIDRGRLDGILDETERRVLVRRAERARERAGYRRVIDPATGMRIGIPFAEAPGRRPSGHGALYEGERVRIETFALRQDLRATYAATLRRPGRQVTYKVLRDDWFVIAGREGDRKFYTRAEARGGELRAFTVTYDRRLGRMDRIVTAMSNDLRPFAREAVRERLEDRLGQPPRTGRGGAEAPDLGGGDTDRGLGGHDGRGGAEPELPPVAEGPPEYTGPGSIERDYAFPGEIDGQSCAERITVSPGDTLSAIAGRCGTSVAALRAANGGVDPYALRAGQSLVVPQGYVEGQEAYEIAEAPRAPEAGETDAEGYRPAIAVRPRAMREGETVAIALTGFPSGAAVTVRLSAGGETRAERVLTTGSGGAAAAQFSLPAAILAGQAVTVRASSGPHGAEAGPFVVRPAEAAGPSPLSLSGMITEEGGPCLSMRDSSGTLWMLDSARSVAPGTAVTVEGFPAGPEAAERCGGQAVEVARLSVR